MAAARALIGRAEPTAAAADALLHARPVVVVGEVGVGKTSLVREAAARAGRRLHEGGGFATLSWLPFLALRRAVPIVDVTEPAGVAAVVRAAVGDGALFIDDHHWADDSTRAVVDLLVGQLPLAVAIRLGEPGAVEAVNAFQRQGAVVVRLGGLDRAAALELTRRHIPGGPEAVRQGVVEAAGGNPLVLETLAAHGEVPSWLTRVLLRQLDRLPAAERGALERMAAAGRPLAPEQIGPACPALREAGLLEPRAGGLAVRHRVIAEALRLDGRAVAAPPPRRRARPAGRSIGRDPRGRSVAALIAAGRLRAAVELADALSSRPIDQVERQRIVASRGLALALLGRFDEAEQALAGAAGTGSVAATAGAAASTSASARPGAAVAVLQAQAEASLWGGRPRRALDQAVAACRAAATDADRVSASLTAAWAAAELGESSRPPVATVPAGVAGASDELRGLEELQAGALAAAAAAFERASAWWQGRDEPRHLRCRWAAGDARRRHGDPGAVASLRASLAAAVEMGFEPLAARIRRSLRLAGERTPGERVVRAAGDLLTARERQVLQQVERGRTNSEIARRMGLGRPTVARMLSNAMTKLGAQSRTQAVVLAAERLVRVGSEGLG